MSDKLRVLVVGCGGISGGWFRTAAELKDVEIVGLMDLSEEACRKRQSEFGLDQARVGTELAPMLRDLQPDVVWNLTIPAAHREVTLAALEAGAHVLSEKPLADSMDAAREMVAAAKSAGKLFAVMQNRRYTNSIRAARSFLQTKAIGEISTVNCDFYIGAHFGGFRDRMEHVLLLDMAIHTFDQARLISGANPVSVYCHEWNPKGSWYDHDASAIAIFEMSDGIIYTYRGSWCCEGANTTWECDWRVMGERGCLLWDGAEKFVAQSVKSVEGFRSEKVDHDIPIPDCGPKSGGHAGCIREFMRCVRDGSTPETTAEDNIQSLAMVFGAIESAETGQKVQIQL